MSPKSYKIISIISVAISLFLVIGGCFASWLLQEKDVNGLTLPKQARLAIPLVA